MSSLREAHRLASDRAPQPHLGTLPPELTQIVARHLDGESLVEFTSVNHQIRAQILPLVFESITLWDHERTISKKLQGLIQGATDPHMKRIRDSIRNLSIIEVFRGRIEDDDDDRHIADQPPRPKSGMGYHFPYRLITAISLMVNLTIVSLHLPGVNSLQEASYLQILAHTTWQFSSLRIYGNDIVAAAIVRACSPTHLEALQVDGQPGSLIFAAASEVHGKTLVKLHLRFNALGGKVRMIEAAYVIEEVAQNFQNLQWLVLKENHSDGERASDASAYDESRKMRRGLSRLPRLTRFGFSFRVVKLLGMEQPINSKTPSKENFRRLCSKLLTQFPNLKDIHLLIQQGLTYSLNRTEVDDPSHGAQGYKFACDNGFPHTLK